ncbi:MAG: folate family ECF transporter S component [Clostridia bacterium]|nr:folate family ECF transporter S component [Clostridia bacterium]
MSDTKKNFSLTTYDIAFIGLLIALEFVLKSYLQISTPISKIGFGFLPIAVAARRYPIGIPVFVAVAGDLLGYFVVNFGQAFCYGITLTAALTAVCTSLFIHKEVSVKRIIAYVLINNIVGSFLMNTFWLHFQFGIPYGGLIVPRAIQAGVMIVVESIVVITLLTKGDNLINRSFRR